MFRVESNTLVFSPRPVFKSGKPFQESAGVVEGIHPDAVAKALAEREIAVWNGNYYAWELERVLGLAPHGGIRAGFLHYNDASDTERLLAAVAELAA